jgi:hypothetical protein
VEQPGIFANICGYQCFELRHFITVVHHCPFRMPSKSTFPQGHDNLSCNLQTKSRKWSQFLCFQWPPPSFGQNGRETAKITGGGAISRRNRAPKKETVT